MSIGERFNRSLISAGVREVADMNPEPKPAAEPSISELMTQLSSHTSRLVRDEMRLAQKEFVEYAKHAGIGALVSKKQLDQASPTPEMTVANVKQDIHELTGARHDH
jgi:hypothetical protein